MKKFLIIFVFSIATMFAQSGPAVGSISSGKMVNTENFSAYQPDNFNKFRLFNKFADRPKDEPYIQSENIIPDYGVTNQRVSGRDSVILYKKFDGIPETNSIPPDPHCAVGPNHIIVTVNTSFRIYDKEGNDLFTLAADTWYNSTLSSVDAFDPKVMYDHFDGRWIMVWLTQDDATSSSYYMISVSDDDNPLGIWYNYATPSNVNGSSPASVWGDYQGVGYDEKAIYITSNNFTFGNSSFQYVKVRIHDKYELYAAEGGSVSWTDFWNIADFGLRPSRMNEPTEDGSHYFLASRTSGASYVTMYKLSEPLSNPSLTKVIVPVNYYQSPSDPAQLGGNDLIDGGGTNIRNEPVYQGGLLHFTHAVRDGNYSGVKYTSIDVNTNTKVTDFMMSSGEHYYNYPALAVNPDNDVILTYSRSSLNEFMGAYYTILRAGATEPLGSFMLKEGKGYYYKTFGGDRNRWGDYMGAYADFQDSTSFWIFTEFVAANNTWGTYVGAVRVKPFDGTYIQNLQDDLSFGNNEANIESDTLSVTIKNYGNSELSINSITNSVDDFILHNSISFPLVLTSFDSLKLDYTFIPSDSGDYSDEVVITSSDTSRPMLNIPLTGKGYVINPTKYGYLYGVSQNSRDLAVITPSSGAAYSLGRSNISNVFSITRNPLNDELVGIKANDNSTDFVRINAAGGDSYLQGTLNNYVFDAVAYDTSGTLYGVTENQLFLRIFIESDRTEYVATLTQWARALAFNPFSNELWASMTDGSSVEEIYKISTEDGSLIKVGDNGINKVFNALTFDRDGNLYGSAIGAFQKSTLYSIDTLSAVASSIGFIGNFNSINGLAFSHDEPQVSVNDKNIEKPIDFSLNQNFPNPFNPSTQIKFAIPVSSQVKLSIYNVLGEIVTELINDNFSAGYHSVEWDATNLSSGIYFYSIEAVGADGRNYNDSKKMMLVK